MNILAIETSCDETAASVIQTHGDTITVSSNIISSQVDLHAQWGGVVPNLAAREHTKNIIPVLTAALNHAHVRSTDIDLIAVTHCPGLIPALLCGVSAAKSLAYTWHKPLLGIHHIEGHIYANWIDRSDHDIPFPALALVVSGGHTQLILMRAHCTYEVIGETQDDAVGEAFDKTARILGLGYPGGPIISQCAQAFVVSGKNNDITLPRPMLTSGDFHFSFSGLKTSVLYLVKEYRNRHNLSETEQLPNDFVNRVAHAFQEAAIDVLVRKTLRAAHDVNAASILLAGGVSANIQLRDRMKHTIERENPHIRFFTPSLAYCVDNAAMIAIAAHYRFMHSEESHRKIIRNNWKTLLASPHGTLLSLV